MSFQTASVSIGDSTKKSSYDQVLENTIYLKTSATQFTGEKTFQSATVFNATATFNKPATHNSSTVFNATATFNSDLNVPGTATVVSFPSKRITSANYVESDSITTGDLFTKLAPFIPNNGDYMLMTGAAYVAVQTTSIVISKATRVDASNIILQSIRLDSGIIYNLTLSSGSGTSLKVSIAW